VYLAVGVRVGVAVMVERIGKEVDMYCARRGVVRRKRGRRWRRVRIVPVVVVVGVLRVRRWGCAGLVLRDDVEDVNVDVDVATRDDDIDIVSSFCFEGSDGDDDPQDKQSSDRTVRWAKDCGDGKDCGRIREKYDRRNCKLEIGFRRENSPALRLSGSPALRLSVDESRITV
jgi:hypothetical protein